MSLYIPRTNLKKNVCYLLKFSKAGRIITAPLRSTVLKNESWFTKCYWLKNQGKSALSNPSLFKWGKCESWFEWTVGPRLDSEEYGSFRMVDLCFPAEDVRGKSQWQLVSEIRFRFRTWKLFTGPLCETLLLLQKILRKDVDVWTKKYMGS